MRMIKLGRGFLSAVLFLGMVFQSSPRNASSSTGENPAPVFQGQASSEQIVSSLRGLEKLAPDLRELWLRAEDRPSAQGGPSFAAFAEQPLMVSALVLAGADVQDLFSQSARSREIAGLQWVTGEIGLKQLGKLASFDGVVGVISPDTFAKTEAPDFDEQRWNPAGISVKEFRDILNQGGPEKLRESVDAAYAAAEQRNSRQDLSFGSRAFLSPAANEGAGNAPDLHSIHDVDGVHARGITGSGVVVGVVDTGVDFSNPDLQGAQAIIPGGVYAGWPFAYDTVSGARYALDAESTLGPDNFWSLAGATLYVHTLPVVSPACTAQTCGAELELTADGTSAWFTWPNTSKSGVYYYTVHPDINLALMAHNRQMSYPEGWLLPPPVIVADTQMSGVYDTVYIDVNYNHSLLESSERATRAQPLTGADLNEDGLWDLSGGMLSWIADGSHHPPGVTALYPDVAGRPAAKSGRLLAFISDFDGHGTACASEIAGQGKITDPDGLGPSNPLYAGGSAVGGAGGPVVASMAPQAKIAAFQNGFSLPFDSWALAVVGMDGVENSGDEANILSNSWGDSRTIEDGWDPMSRFAQRISLDVAPEVTILAATGNGGHGYGTVTTPGGGPIIDVGASTAYGAVRGFENVTVDQFLYGDIQPWSNRGPGALGDTAPDVVAVGAWGTAAMPLNQNYTGGSSAYDVFGGTSMSTPVAAGGLALIYQAYHERAGVWPDWQTARDLLFNGTQDLGYDVFTQGAGNIRAGAAVDIASGLAPYVTPTQWQAGSYHGAQASAFPNVIHAGEESVQVFTIYNPTESALSVTAASSTLRSVHEQTFSFTYVNPPPKVQQELPIFLKDLTDLVDQYDPDMVRAQVVFPYDSFDVDKDAYADSWWSVYFYDWQDRDGDGTLWVDANLNGRVNQDEMDIDPVSGLYEFNRFSYGSPQGNVIESSIGKESLSRQHDGIFLGLRCKFCGQSSVLQVRVTFYQKVDWPWVSFPIASTAIAAGEQGTIEARLLVPADTLPGAYNGAVEFTLGDQKRTVPVVAHVAASGTTFDFGGQAERDAPYDNNHLLGGFSWNWRYESGDWRFIYYDAPEGTSEQGRSLLVDTRWNSPDTDVDTWILGSEPVSDDLPPLAAFGPQGLKITGGSKDTYTMGGQFLWETSTSSPREFISAPVRDGLGMLALHNVLNGGLTLAEEFSGRMFEARAVPGDLIFNAQADADILPVLSGSETLQFTATGEIAEGIQVQAFGVSAPVGLQDQFVTQNSASNICSSTWIYQKLQGGLEINNGGLLEITTTSAFSDLDLDIYLYQDDGDEKWRCGSEHPVAYSINAGSDEQIKIYFPDDGIYWLVVHGYDVPMGHDIFDLDIHSLAGGDLSVEPLPVGPVSAGQAVDINVHYLGSYPVSSPVALEGLLMIGTAAVPGLLEVPVHVRPEVLIYPQPSLTASSDWVRQPAEQFSLTLQNQGSEQEEVTAEIQIPDGLVYQPDSAAGPGTPPVYDPAAAKLTWTGTVGDGEKVVITFMARAQTGFAPGGVTIPYQVRGANSGQQWQGSTNVWVNLYGVIFPVIRR